MKRIFLAALLLTMPPSPVGWTGMTCSNSQKTITYNSLYSVGLAVNAAYSAYLDKVVAGTATFNSGVATAYNDFQSAFGVAVAAAQMNNAAVAPQNVVDLANKVYAAIKQFTK